MRRQARELVQQFFPGLPSYSSNRPLGNVITAITSSLTRGSHDIVSGETKLNQDVRAGLRRLAQTLPSGRPPTITDANAMRTLIHEEMHGHSAIGVDQARRTAGHILHGQVLEEVGVELHARLITSRALGVPYADFDATGGYVDYVNALRAEVAGVFGQSGVDDRIRAAVRQAWSAGPGAIRDPDDYLDRFLDALALPNGRERTRLRFGILTVRRP